MFDIMRPRQTTPIALERFAERLGASLDNGAETTPAHREVAVTGVTGTDGKTTTYMLSDVIEALGVRAGLSGAVERIVGDEHVLTSESGRLTTPESDVLHGTVAHMRDAQVGAAAIEVSSHGVDGDRIDGLPFDVAIFTNLSQDHLDEYGTLERYFAAKLALFTPEHATGRHRSRR